MAPRTEGGKRLREVRDYKRRNSSTGKSHYVKSYYQRYDKPRGGWNSLGADAVTGKNKTLWLKDSAGKFVGRSNAQGKTTARRVAEAGADKTSNWRERGKYGRIRGRTSSRR
jgi:hypothetical protein